MRKIVLIGIIIFTIMRPSMNHAETPISTTISGFIYDEANGEALIGANVFLEGTMLGSSTNLSGYYVIPKIPPGNYNLIVDYVGYKTCRQVLKITSGENKKLNIYLQLEPLQIEEIVVTADSLPTIERLFQKPISEIKLTPRQINRVPQIAETDLLRSMQTLPGILALSDYSSALYVRGGTPDQNLYLMDGTDVYNPEHMFGLFSTFNTDAIKQVDLSRGGFGAEYGGRLSSVLNITNLDGNREEFEGTSAISLLSAKTTLQMPIGRTGSVSGSLRRTYFDQTVAKFKDDLPDYYYYDGNVKAFFEFDKNNKLTISGYGGRDVLNFEFSGASTAKTGFQYDWGNKTGSIRYTRVFSPRLFSNFWITGSRFSSNFRFPEYRVEERNVINDLTFKGSLEYHHSTFFSTKFGFEQKNLKMLYRQVGAEEYIDIQMEPQHFITYLQTTWRPSPRWELEAGLHYDLFKNDTSFQNIEPRFSMKYRATDKINLKATTGIYHQYLHRIPRFIMADIWSASNRYQDGAMAVHYTCAYQQEIAADFELEVELYHKTYENIFVFNPTIEADITADEFTSDGRPKYTKTDGIFKRGDGNTTGLEFLLRKDVGRLNGWIGYSFSKTKYKFDGINQGKPFNPRHDRTSTLNVVTNLNLSKVPGKWLWGLNFIYATGQPYTEPGSAYIIASSPAEPGRALRYAPTKINNIRFPAYIRLDLSLTYTKKFENWSIAPYIQVFNVGNRKNVWFVDYNYSWGLPQIDEQYMLPILPTVGVNMKF